jgi:hypothetical protein
MLSNNIHLSADSETVTLDSPHAPHAAALQAFSFVEQAIKHAYVIRCFVICYARDLKKHTCTPRHVWIYVVMGDTFRVL